MNQPNTRQKVGYVLAGLIGATSVLGVFVPVPQDEPGPPFVVIVLGALLGILGLVGVVIAWRTGSRLWARITAAALTIGAITALPAFFVPGVPIPLVAWAGVTVIATIAAIALMFSGARHLAVVAD